MIRFLASSPPPPQITRNYFSARARFDRNLRYVFITSSSPPRACVCVRVCVRARVSSETRQNTEKWTITESSISFQKSCRAFRDEKKNPITPVFTGEEFFFYFFQSSLRDHRGRRLASRTRAIEIRRRKPGVNDPVVKN